MMDNKYFIQQFIKKYGEDISYIMADSKYDIKAIFTLLGSKNSPNINFSKLGVVNDSKYYLCCSPIDELVFPEGTCVFYKNQSYFVSHSDIVYFNNSPLYTFASLYKSSQKEIEINA